MEDMFKYYIEDKDGFKDYEILNTREAVNIGDEVLVEYNYGNSNFKQVIKKRFNVINNSILLIVDDLK